MTRLITLDMRHNSSPHVSKTHWAGTDPAYGKHLTVFLDGIQSSGFRPGFGVQNLLLQRGDLLIINYPLSRGFDSQQVVRNAMEVILKYRQVTLVGVSMGGLLAHDIKAAIDAQPDGTRKPTVRLILVSAPSGAKRLADEKGARLVMRVPAVPTPKWLRRLWFNEFRGFKLRMPAYANDLTKWEKRRLENHCKRSAVYPIGPWLRQLRYIVQHPGPSAKVLRGVPTAFLWSPEDEVVSIDAGDDWKRVVGEASFHERPVPSAAHTDMLEFPAAWTDAFEWALKELDIQPLA